MGTKGYGTIGTADHLNCESRMKLSMSSMRQSACSDDLEFDPCNDMSFSWWGIKLFVDLQIDPRSPENVHNGGETSVADHTVLRDTDQDDDVTKELRSSRESSSLQDDTDALRDHDHLVNHENDESDCNRLLTSEVEDQCGAAPEADTNWTYCTWPDWGEPLPPEDLDDDIALDCTGDGEENPNSKKAVTFSDVVTTVEPVCLQEERETGSFSYAGSSDEELEQGTDQVTSSSDGNAIDLSPVRVPCAREKESLNLADVSAACNLLELGNESNRGNSNVVGLESSGVAGKRKSDFYDPSRDLERLSELVEKLYAAAPHLSIFSNFQDNNLSKDLRSWTIDVFEDSGRLKMKRIKREEEAELEFLGVLDVDDDNEVLDRPARKRQYKSLNKFP